MRLNVVVGVETENGTEILDQPEIIMPLEDCKQKNILRKKISPQNLVFSPQTVDIPGCPSVDEFCVDPATSPMPLLPPGSENLRTDLLECQSTPARRQYKRVPPSENECRQDDILPRSFRPQISLELICSKA